MLGNVVLYHRFGSKCTLALANTSFFLCDFSLKPIDMKNKISLSMIHLFHKKITYFSLLTKQSTKYIETRTALLILALVQNIEENVIKNWFSIN